MSMSSSIPKNKLIISVGLWDPDRVRIRTDGCVDPETILAICPEDEQFKKWVNKNRPEEGMFFSTHLCG